MSSSYLVQFLLTNLAYFPFLLIYSVGILICILRWKIHPNVSLYSLIAFSLFLITGVLNFALSFLMFRAASSGDNFQTIITIQGWARFLFTALDIVGWTLLIITNFFLRPAATKEYQPVNQPSYPPPYQYPKQ